jgi:hypothetical protein
VPLGTRLNPFVALPGNPEDGSACLEPGEDGGHDIDGMCATLELDHDRLAVASDGGCRISILQIIEHPAHEGIW